MDRSLSSHAVVSALILLETDCLKGSNYFQKNPVTPIDHNNYQLNTATTNSNSNNINENRFLVFFFLKEILNEGNISKNDGILVS